MKIFELEVFETFLVTHDHGSEQFGEPAVLTPLPEHVLAAFRMPFRAATVVGSYRMLIGFRAVD